MFYDVFMGVTMTWCHEQIQQTSGDMTYRYRLKLSKLNRSKVDAYLQHVRNEFEEIQAKDRDLTVSQSSLQPLLGSQKVMIRMERKVH